MILPDFRDSLVFHDFELLSPVLLRKFHDKKFHDHSEIHENHEIFDHGNLELYM